MNALLECLIVARRKNHKFGYGVGDDIKTLLAEYGFKE